MDHKTLHALVTATDRLDAIAFELNKAAVWSADAGDETASDLINEAAIRLLAAARLLDRPIRADPPPQRWNGADMPGQHVREPRLRRPAPGPVTPGARAGSRTGPFRPVSGRLGLKDLGFEAKISSPSRSANRGRLSAPLARQRPKVDQPDL